MIPPKKFEQIKDIVKIGTQVKIISEHNICEGGLNGYHIGSVDSISRIIHSDCRDYDWYVTLKNGNGGFAYQGCFEILNVASKMFIEEDGSCTIINDTGI